MKFNKRNILAFVLLPGMCAILLTTCCTRTIEPVVPSGERIVLIEEFTGKGCTNCPKGTRELENLLSIYGDNLVAVSIHANFFANPQFFPLGKYDLRTDEGEQLFHFLGPNLGYPSAVVNRRKFNNDFQHGANVWAGLIAQESAIAPLVEFVIIRGYEETSRTLHVFIEGRAKSTITNPTRVSVMIVENGIIDAQDDVEAGGIVEDYEHNHVLRDMITPYDGDALAPSLEAGEEFQATFTYTIPTEWDAARCNIIAFISVHASGDISVLQAGEAHVTD